MQYYVVDAFTDEHFKGNPAGVCILNSELPVETMQKIAFENNLAETAFVIKKGVVYALRWFTPEVEIDLCGHATLAAAFVLMNYYLDSIKEICFETKSGFLYVTRGEDVYTMDFPSRMPAPIAAPPTLEQALGCKISETYIARDLLVIVENENTVKKLTPDFQMLSKISKDLSFAIIVSAVGDDCDFVSRFFAPNAGILEDPVTGSSHSTLIPFWAKKLNKSKMSAKQLSPRGGALFCENAGERVRISGKAVCYLTGEIMI